MWKEQFMQATGVNPDALGIFPMAGGYVGQSEADAARWLEDR
jgi:hypothetical protein